MHNLIIDNEVEYARYGFHDNEYKDFMEVFNEQIEEIAEEHNEKYVVRNPTAAGIRKLAKQKREIIAKELFEGSLTKPKVVEFLGM